MIALTQTPLLLRIAASGLISPESSSEPLFLRKRNFPFNLHPVNCTKKTAIMSFRAGLRFFNAFRQQAANTGKPIIQRRTYQSAAETNATPPPNQSRLQQLWSSPVGPKTVHFWAPIMKWGLVLAGAADFARPVESLSLSQNGALMATGLIWTRWCFVIKPRNLFLASVNFLLFCVGATQVSRILLWQQAQKGDSIPAELEKAGKQEGKELEAIVKDPKGAFEKAKKV
ncbi:UPF0041-domain-containing protein [Aureobasidium pullulans]|nr:UPF0041-domain-containing protein [Aureobasidium pullulans]